MSALKKIVSGRVGRYDVLLHGDVVIVVDEKETIGKRKVPGLTKFLDDNHDRVRLTLGHTEDFRIVGLWGEDGYGYALNLDAPKLSEWGYGGR